MSPGEMDLQRAEGIVPEYEHDLANEDDAAVLGMVIFSMVAVVNLRLTILDS